MLAEERNRRQKTLEENIHELSKKMLEDSEIRVVSLRLLEIYKGDFKHSYSGFFPLILEISKGEQQEDIEYLSNNLESIRTYIENDLLSGVNEFKDIYERINKLCDHINVEIGRWNYYSQNEQKIEDISSTMTNLNSKMATATNDLRKASEQAASIQTELIAVLSIFAAIVVTFSGGFTFLGSVMTSISSIEYYESVVLVALVCGLVIFNTIFLLLYMVGKIINRNIYAVCEDENCSCKNTCKNLTRIRKRLPYVFYFNLLSAAGIIVDLVVWYADIKNWFGI
jgi:hypothetical protein